MPEMHFSVRWPDNSVTDCYSPSLVIKEYLEVGKTYPLDDFVARSATALHIGSERVRQKFGYACSSALDQLQRIEATASRFQDVADAQVSIEGFRP
ncbi:MSMEG_0570 family nitrogen starvation response protein [Herbaspirillum sp. RV1423]|uniref:MSMEG_0570 family nitrogen starvation response protein n=1 Tax=Herbaspirillum sp. RV1423 TaxID=1443993 RepID=UPI0004BCE699|nr:MSMEG_0570 family nitrogen starvation response protein [Herbaspirillum sp. RV1423]